MLGCPGGFVSGWVMVLQRRGGRCRRPDVSLRCSRRSEADSSEPAASCSGSWSLLQLPNGRFSRQHKEPSNVDITSSHISQCVIPFWDGAVVTAHRHFDLLILSNCVVLSLESSLSTSHSLQLACSVTESAYLLSFTSISDCTHFLF